MRKRIVTSVLFASVLSFAFDARAIDPGKLQVVLDDKASAVEHRVADIFAAEIRRRTGRDLAAVNSTGAKYSLVLRTDKNDGLKTDGFRLTTTPDPRGRMFVVGQSPSGLVAGVGKLLRISRYAPHAITIPPTTLEEAPKMPVRGMYFATHFHNFYHVAPVDEVDRVIEELALWGGNALHVWFDMHHFKSLQDPAAQKHLKRLKHFAKTAHGIGMQFGLLFLGNEGYASSPKHLRATQVPGGKTYGVEVCPATAEGMKLIGRWQAELLDAFPRVDVLWSWPYDQGGCGCEQCRPWGGNGFIRVSEQMAKLYFDRFPDGQLWMSTWRFDCPHQGDYDGLFRYLREQKPDWLQGLVARPPGPQGRVFDRPHPERYRLACFPEISMYGMSPWGGCGANPQPDRFSQIMSNVRGRTVGGWPYSEGIYEDLNKFLWMQFFWNPDRLTDDVLAEYAAHYLAPDVADQGVKLLHLLEKTHARRNWAVRNLEQADEAHLLATEIDTHLPDYAKTSWRWRILYIRAAIDHVLKNHGFASDEARVALKPFCDELRRIYHAEHTFIAPPKFPPPPDPKNLAHGKPVSVSSTAPKPGSSKRTLVDGIRSDYDRYSFWAHDAGKEKTAVVTIDLGRPYAVKEVRLQFRNIQGVFSFIPESVGVEVSQDGNHFDALRTSRRVPKEGAKYSPRFWGYEIGKRGRYLRITLGPSQHVGDQNAGLLELTEIEVHGE